MRDPGPYSERARGVMVSLLGSQEGGSAESFPDMRHLELDATVDAWPGEDGRTRVLLLAINVNGYYSLPVRILTLAAHGAADLARRYDTRYVEFDWTDDPDAWLERIVRWRADILGLSVNVWNLTRMMDLAGAVKRRLPLTTVLAGGQEVTHSVVDHLETYAALDYTIDGEGEIPFRQFLTQWCPDTRQLGNPAAVSGLRHRADGRPRFTGAADVVGSLDEIPSPILAGLVPVAGKDRLGVLLESSRGCPYKCSFCFEGAKAEKVRMYSLDRLRREAVFMAERGAHYFHILDPILANSIALRLKGVAEIFAHLRETHPRMSFSVEAYADHISDKTAAHLSDCTIIDIGLQTTNPDTIQAIHRWFNEERFVEGVRLLRQLETTINIYLISGLPHETVVTFLRGIRFALDQKPTRLFLNELCLLNGTELRWRAAEYGYEFDAQPPYYARANKWLTRLQLAAIQALTRDVSHRYNLSMRCFSNTVPWLTKKRREDGWNGTLRVHVGADAHTVDSILAQAEEQDLELCASDDSDPDAVLRLAGRFLLAGTARLKLVAPASLLRDQEYLRRLSAGAHVWQYRTFLDPPGPADRRRVLDDLGAQLERMGRLHPRDSDQIKPHVELCILPAPIEHVAEAVRWAATQSPVSVVTAIPPNVDPDVTWSAALAELFAVVIPAGRWLRLPERTMRRVLAAAGVDEMDEVLLHLAALDLLVPDDVRLLLPTSPAEPAGMLRPRPSRLSASRAERDPVVMRNR